MAALSLLHISGIDMEPPTRSRNELQWVQNTFSSEPRWTRNIEPDLISKAIVLDDAKTLGQVTYLARGALNKIYTAQVDGKSLIIRVPLPVDPGWKTASEVATMAWVGARTALPIPKVLAYEDSLDNPLGFEWIVVTKMPGITLSAAWISIDWKSKLNLVHHLAVSASAFFQNQLQGIGNIYPGCRGNLPSGTEDPKVGRIVSMEFFWGGRARHNVSRGPFQSSNAWIRARLSLAEQDCTSTLASSQDDDEVEDAQRTLKIVQRLQTLSHTVFDPEDPQSEPTMLHHDDLSQHNILVDERGRLTGVLDWECVSAVPLWKACCYPKFLTGPNRASEPERRAYLRESNGEQGALYKEHLMEYELTLLRHHFMEELSNLQPRWIDIFNRSQIQRDFDLAVNSCDSEFLARHVNKWIDALTSQNGEIPSLYHDINT